MKTKFGTWGTGGKAADVGGRPGGKDKVGKVMHEFKTGALKSSSGQKVTNPKQAQAIALSEARRANKGDPMAKTKKFAAGGMPDQSNKGGAARGLDRAASMSGRDLSAATPATGRPGMKKGGTVKKLARGGGVEVKGKTKGKVL